MNWKKHRLSIAGGAFVVLLALTLWAYYAHRPEDQVYDSAEVALPKVDKNKVDELEIYRPSIGQIVVLKKEGNAWFLVKPIRASTDASSVGSALDALADLEYRGIAAHDQSNHALLEVDNAHGVRVTAKSKGKVLIDAIVGALRGSNTMLRLVGQDKVTAVSGSIKYAFNKEVRDWRDRSIIDLKEDQLTAISAESDNGRFAFQETKGQWSLAKGQKAIAKFDPAEVGSWVRGLLMMRASDFAPNTVQEGIAGLEKPKATLTMTGKDGNKIELKLGKARDPEANNYYLMRVGRPIIYIVSKYIAEQLQPKAERFKKKEQKKPEGGPPGAVPPAGMPMMPTPP